MQRAWARPSLPQARDRRRDLPQIRSRYGGLGPSDAGRLRSLDEESARLKTLLAEPMLDASTLREMLGRTGGYLKRRACSPVGVAPKTLR